MVPFQKESIKAIAFDIDGTIFSSEDIILETYIEAFQEYRNSKKSDLKIPDRASIMDQIGKPVKTIFLNLIPEVPEIERDAISDTILQILCRRIESGAGKMYPGIQEGIETLHKKGFKIFAASNGRIPYIISILRTSKTLQFFNDLATLDYDKLNVKADLLNFYKQKYNFLGSEILMVGDRYSDYEAAVVASCPFAFCEYGHSNPGEITESSIQLKEFKDLLKYL